MTTILRKSPLLLLVLAGCAGAEADCLDSRCEMSKVIWRQCQLPEFRGTPMCSDCVPRGFFSIDDDCTCQPLVFDQANCYSKTDDLAIEEVRSALAFAADVCGESRAEIPSTGDGGAGGASGGDLVILAEKDIACGDD